MWGLSGSSRVGKSTLAEGVSELTELPYVKAPDLIKELGIDMSKDMSMSDRLDYQEKRLDAAIEVYRANKGGFITDRTPIDMLAYTLAECLKAPLTEDLEQRLFNYKYRCIEAVNTYFQHIWVIQPGIEYVEEEGKPPANLAYQEHISALILGILKDDLVTVEWSILKRHITDKELRKQMITKAIFDEWQKLETRNSSITLH